MSNLALAVIGVLVIIVIYQYWKSNNQLVLTPTDYVPPAYIPGNMGSVDTRTRDDPHGPWNPQPPYDAPWTSMAARSAAAPQTRMWPNSKMSQRGLADAGVDRDRVADAEREAWYTSDAEMFSPNPNTAEMSSDPTSADPSGLDYARYTTDLIVDPRMRENHRQWVEELGPWSGSLRHVDDLDEALESSTHFVGLQRPIAVPVDNPTQVTELGPEIFENNHKIRFHG